MPCSAPRADTVRAATATATELGESVPFQPGPHHRFTVLRTVSSEQRTRQTDTGWQMKPPASLTARDVRGGTVFSLQGPDDVVHVGACVEQGQKVSQSALAGRLWCLGEVITR